MIDDPWKAIEERSPAAKVCEKFGHQPEKRELWNLYGVGLFVTKCTVCGEDLFYGEMNVRFANPSRFVKWTLEE